MTIDRIPTPSLHAFAASLFTQAAFPEGQPLHALLDHALAPGLHVLDAGPVVRLEAHNLHGHLAGADKHHSPWLLKLPPARPEQIDLLARLLMESEGLPMLSILVSPWATDAAATKALAAHLAFHTQVALPPDGRAYLLRFADARILPVLDALLDPAQRQQFFGPVGTWAYPDRQGNWAFVRGEGTLPSHPPKPLALSEAQLDAFEWATLPDSIMARLRAETAWPADLAPSSRHRLVCQWLDEARAEAEGQADPGACLVHCRNALAAMAPLA